MHVSNRPQIVSFALKTLASAVACAVLLSPAANAAGLGKLTVLSSLGQPLRAEIELTAVAAEDAGALVAKLAPPEAYRAANIDYNPTLMSLRFEVEQRNGRQVIRVSSTQAVNEPFVDMLLELNWTGGRLVREYTFLLDPAEMRATQSAQVAAPVELAPRQAAPAAAAPAAAAPSSPSASAPPAAPSAAAATAAARAPAAPSRQPGSEYKVKEGDNLTRIANQVKPTDISLDLMLVALYRANPEAFSGNNMNRLKSGQILAVPDADTVRAGASDSEAHGVVVAHAVDFNAYRAKLAGQVAGSAPAKDAEPAQNISGKISAKVEEKKTAVNEAKDQLKLSKSTSGAPVAGKSGTALEDKIADQKQMDEAAARMKELEKNVSDLEKLMTLKGKPAPEGKKASASAKAAASASASASASAAAAKPPRTMVVPPRRTVEPSLFETMMANLSSVGLALAAVLGGVVLLLARRRKAAEQATVEPSILGDTAMPAQQLIAEAGGQSVDTNNSVFNSNFAPSASQLDTNEVDPVAEADVYIAYGRDAQAEEILKEALRTHPERHPVRLKLLEIYSARKDARAFETQATELYAQTRGHGDEWPQALAMGVALDPYNPLYANNDGGAVAASAAPEAAAAPSAADFSSDFGADAPAADLDFDLGQEAPAADKGMDFSRESEMETALPQLAELEAPSLAAMAAEAEKDEALDFDLGSLSFDAIEPATPAAAAIDEPALEERKFDLSFDEPLAAPIAAPAAATPDAAALDAMDFGLDLPELPAEKAAAPVSDPLAELDLMDFDIPAMTAEAEAAKARAADDAAALEPDAADDETEAPAAEVPAAHEFDLSGIDLDLDGVGAGAGAAAAGEVDSQTREDKLSAHHMEMDTKLDLAVAYQEIGDKEGARELLDEVIRGGSDDQIAKANAMRLQLN